MALEFKRNKLNVKDGSGDFVEIPVLGEQKTEKATVGELAIEVSRATAAEEAIAARVDKLQKVVGSPFVAATAASMTNTDRVYVYTGSETGYTAGNWYYYDGTAWVSGGVYNSAGVNVDDTLTYEGMAADAKATGDEISNVKNAIDQLPNASKPQTIKFDCVVGANVFECAIIPGCTYRCINNAGGRISVSSCTENGTEIEQVLGGEYTKDRTFVPTQSASYVRIYSSPNSGEVLVYNEDNPSNNLALFEDEVSNDLKSVAVINRGEFFWGDTPIIENETVNAGTGVISAQNGYERTDYISLDNFPLELKIQNNLEMHVDYSKSTRIYF